MLDYIKEFKKIINLNQWKFKLEYLDMKDITI